MLGFLNYPMLAGPVLGLPVVHSLSPSIGRKGTLLPVGAGVQDPCVWRWSSQDPDLGQGKRGASGCLVANASNLPPLPKLPGPSSLGEVLAS